MRVYDRISFEEVEGLGNGQKVGQRGMYVVRGPQGEFYGRYPHPPRPDQIPLYATVELEKPGWRVGFGQSDEDQGMF